MPKTFEWGEGEFPEDRELLESLIDAEVDQLRLDRDATDVVLRSLMEIFSPSPGAQQSDKPDAQNPSRLPMSEASITAARRIVAAAVTTSATTTLAWIGPLTFRLAENVKEASADGGPAVDPRPSPS